MIKEYSNQTIENNILLIKEIINSEINTVFYHSSNLGAKHKTFVLKAFLNLLNKFPIEMTQYLFNAKRRGFQHLLFQEYIFLLESSLPLHYRKNNKDRTIIYLLDDDLYLFDGISVFDSIVDEKGFIYNKTKEFYVGGRKAKVTKPFYIGKLLNITVNDISIMNCVKEYTFSLIKLKNIKKDTLVRVTHLRIPPHYQMGGMSYINRVRKNIVQKLKG